MQHMLSFETIANLVAIAVLISLVGLHFYGRRRFDRPPLPERNDR